MRLKLSNKIFPLLIKPVELFDLITGRTEIIRNSKLIVSILAETIGPRSFNSLKSLQLAKKYISDCFKILGAETINEDYIVNGVEVGNVIAEIKGTTYSKSIIIIGAHYDTIDESSGANDNGSGIAAIIELYRLLSSHKLKCTVRFVAFTLEEPPFHSTENMGSIIHAKRAIKRHENIELMISIDMIGYGGTFIKQNYPTVDMKKIYPERGNFIIFAALPSYAKHAYQCKKLFNQYCKVSAHEIIAPASINGMNSSDHHSFNKFNIPALMITDTGFYRNKNYHTENDRIETINYRFLSENIYGIYKMIKDLANTNR